MPAVCVGVWLGVEYLVAPETPDMSESAFLDLDESAAGITGAVGGSSTCVLGRFWKGYPQPAAGLSGSGLGGKGERVCAGEGLKGTKPRGSPEGSPEPSTTEGDRGLSTFGSGRSCASSGFSISRPPPVDPKIFVSSEYVFEVGRDGGTTSILYSSLDIEDVLCRLGVRSMLIEGERTLCAYPAAAFDWRKLELECEDRTLGVFIGEAIAEDIADDMAEDLSSVIESNAPPGPRDVVGGPRISICDIVVDVWESEDLLLRCCVPGLIAGEYGPLVVESLSEWCVSEAGGGTMIGLLFGDRRDGGLACGGFTSGGVGEAEPGARGRVVGYAT